MTIEVEKKYRLEPEERGRVLAKLKSLGAEFSREDFELNELYRGGVLETKRAVLRVRKIRDKTILTYKERLESASAVKRQIEHETAVEDSGAIADVIECLGFKKSLVYEKRRQTWRLNGVEILLDELPFGQFMEIEGAEAEIIATELLLGAENFRAECETYPDLTAAYGTQNGSLVEARFAENP